MKHFITTIVTILAFAFISFPVFADDNTSYKVEGKTVSVVKQSSESNDILTDYIYEDSKGEQYPIYLHKCTKGENAGSYTCYVFRTSKKTGSQYKYWLKNGQELAKRILRETNNKNQ